MDPSATLELIRQAIADDDREEAEYLLSCYWQWRKRGGFQPDNGDNTARQLQEQITGGE